MTIAVQPARQCGGRGCGVVRLDGEQHRPVQSLRQVGRGDGRQLCGEVLDRAADGQAALVHGPDDGRIGVADHHVMAVPNQSSGDRTADGTASKHEVAHGARCYNTVKASGIPQARYLQNAS